MDNVNKTPEEILNESNRVNNINQRVHDMGDATISVSMSVYELLKQNGYDLSSNFGPLYDYCKKKNNDMIVINRDIKALVSYEEDLSKKEASTKNFYDAMFNQYKTGYLDIVEDLITNDPEFTNSAPDDTQITNGKNEFVVRMNEIKYLLGIDVYNSEDYSDKLKKAKKNLSDNYERFRNLTPDEVQTKGPALRNSIEQNRYYISQLERRMEAVNDLGAPKRAIDSPEQVNELMSKLKYLSNSYVNSIKLTKETRIKLIEIFDRIRMLVADYRNYVLNYNTIERKYNKLINEMGIVKASAKTKVREALDAETDIDNGFAPLSGDAVEPKEKPQDEFKPEPPKPIETPAEEKPQEKSSEKPQEKSSENKPKDSSETSTGSEDMPNEEETDFDEEKLFHVGDTVIYNGRSESVKGIGAPKGLEIGKEYKIDNIILSGNGLVYLMLEGVPYFVDSAVFEKLVKDDKKETGEPDKGKPEEHSEQPVESPKPEKKDEPKEKGTTTSTSSELEDEKTVTKGHDYKVLSNDLEDLAPVWRLASFLGIAITISSGVPALCILAGWLAIEGYKKIIDAKARDVITGRKVKERIKKAAKNIEKAASEGSSTVTENDVAEVKELVAEVENSIQEEKQEKPEEKESEKTTEKPEEKESEKTTEKPEVENKTITEEKKPSENQSQEDLEADDIAKEIQKNMENTLKPAGNLPIDDKSKGASPTRRM